MSKKSYDELFTQSKKLNDLLITKLLSSSGNLTDEQKDQVTQLLSTIESNLTPAKTEPSSGKTLKEKLKSRLKK